MAAEQESKNDDTIEVGEVYEARIEELGEGGRGLANLDGYVVLVPGAKPGDNVKIKITKIFGRVAFGKIMKR